MAADPGNLRMSYKSDATHAITVRCDKFGWSFSVIAPESHAREHRAMYPHQRAPGKFFVQLKFLNYAEYRALMDFLRGYATDWLHPPTATPSRTPGITCALARGEYIETRIGVPVGGITDGDHVGNIGYNSPIVFQEITDPLDPKTFTGADLTGLSQVQLGDSAQTDPNNFFYPSSRGSEDSSTPATDIYGLGAQSGPDPTASGQFTNNVGGILTPGGIGIPVTGLPGA